jgi:hypothetical protein
MKQLLMFGLVVVVGCCGWGHGFCSKSNNYPRF